MKALMPVAVALAVVATATAAGRPVEELPALPHPDSGPTTIAIGPDGNLWFTEDLGNRIGRMTLDGTLTEFPLPVANSRPRAVAEGPDGALWFGEFGSNRIGRMTTDGVLT